MNDLKWITVELSWPALQRAVVLGKARNERSEARRSRPNHDAAANGTDQALINHIIGAYGEFAFAKVYGFPEPTSIDTFHKPDFEPDIQVRARNPVKHGKGDLIFRIDDDVNERFVLAHVRTPYVTLIGWWFGFKCKQDCFFAKHGDREPAWFVPGRLLDPIAELVV